MPSWAEGKSNKEIQKINTEIQRLCKEDNFEYVDVFDKLIGEDGQLSREYTVDGIHLLAFLDIFFLTMQHIFIFCMP